MSEQDEEAPSLKIHLQLTPSELRSDGSFQEHYRACKLKLQNVVLWWQRSEASRLGDDFEEIGKRVKMSEQMMILLDDCSDTGFKIGNSKKERPKLHNKGY